MCLVPSLSAKPTTRVEKSSAGYDRILQGDWRDLKTLFEFAGIYPPKDGPASHRDHKLHVAILDGYYWEL